MDNNKKRICIPYSVEYDLLIMIRDYKNYGKVIVAYDFDDTVHTDEPKLSETVNRVCNLLRSCSKYARDIDMICYTCRGDDTITTEVIPHLDNMRIRHDKINENSDNISEEAKKTLSNKIMFTIFLDNRAGLVHTYKVLSHFLTWLKVQKGEMMDIFGYDELEEL